MFGLTLLWVKHVVKSFLNCWSFWPWTLASSNLRDIKALN